MLSAGCATCFGAVYTLAVTDDVSTSYFDYHVVLTIDTTGGLTIDATHVQGVDFKVSSHLLDAELLAISFSGDTSGWQPTLAGPLSSSSICQGVSDGFACNKNDPTAGDDLAVVPGTSLAWEWDIKLADNVDLFPNLIGAHIGAKYWSEAHPEGWLTSEEAPIPEPQSAILFCVGALVVGEGVRRRLRTAA